MKTKFFIVLAVIQIALAIFSLTLIDELVATLEDTNEQMEQLFGQLEEKGEGTNETEIADPFDFGSSMEDIDMKALYRRMLTIFSVFHIITGVIIIWNANKDQILKHRNTIGALLLISFFTGITLVQNIVCLVMFIVLMCLKRERPEDYPEEKRKIEKVVYEQKTKGNIIKAVIAILAYVALYVLFPMALDAAFPNMSEKSALIFGSIIPCAIVFILIFELYKNEIKTSLDAIKENKRSYKYLIVKTFIITLILVAFFNLVRIMILGGVSENQKELNNMNFLIMAPLAVIFAPLVEECLFRGSIRKFINNKYAFILVSGVLFGALHAVSESGLFAFVITTIPYSIMGISFAYTYEKTNNILAPMAMHFLNNFIAVVAMFMLLGI